MTLAPGSRLGPYEILSPLGTGGMGEVFRARDTRLGRDIAIKLVHPRFSADAEQLRRFEQEARAASQLDHPNILVVHDIGSHEGSPYIVSELLDGESLRDKLGEPLPPKKAIEYAVQVAHGLAAAHEKGIVHRDLKPENLFVTNDGRIKILDFGIAKLVQPSIPSLAFTEAPTAAPATGTGVVMGTVGYMSPEQVMAKPLDARSDLFSLGVVLYEMLSGKRPFQKGTAAETMAAILKEEPPELSGTNKPVPPGLDRVVRHCLEKDPTNRFQSARDVAFALESLSQSATAGTAPVRAPGRKRWLAVGSLGLVLLAASYAGVFLWAKHFVKTPVPSFKRITFRRGSVTFARFTPDFQSVVYSAAWGEKPSELFVQRLASADARPLGVSGRVLATAGGDVLVRRAGNILARLPLEGGTPRDLLENVDEATWDRSGTRLAIVRVLNGHFRLEYPVGKVLLETTRVASIDCPHLSPDGERIAFAYHPNNNDSASDICLVEESGQKRTLSTGWSDMDDLAWSPDGKEVWFSATREALPNELHAVTLSGRERLVARFPGRIVVGDIAPGGRVLLSLGQRRWELRGRMAGDAGERDLSWLDGTLTPTLAPDGTQMVFQEWGEGGGADASTYHRRMDGSIPKRLGDGTPYDVSPDWKTVLVGVGHGENIQLKLVPIGAGESVTLPRGSIHTYQWCYWHPDGKRIVIFGSDAEGQTRLFVQEVAGGLPRPSERLAYWGRTFSHDGRFIPVKLKEGGPWLLYPIDGGEPRPLPFVRPEEEPIVFGDDGKSLFVRASVSRTFPMRVVRVDLKTGRREPWLELSPPDLAEGIGAVSLTPNGRFYTYFVYRTASDLYLVEGLR
jgi:serine/threonine protein kinase